MTSGAARSGAPADPGPVGPGTRSRFATPSRSRRRPGPRWRTVDPCAARTLGAAFLVLVVGLAAAACSRDETLGPVEAVEVLVLDGVPRTQATCMVDRLADDLDLAKVTGLDLDLSAAELSVLAAAASDCAPTLGDGGGVIGGSGSHAGSVPFDSGPHDPGSSRPDAYASDAYASDPYPSDPYPSDPHDDGPVGAPADPGTNLGSATLGPVDIEDDVDRLVAGGLELDLATCLTTRLLREDDPAVILEDRFALSSLIVDCRESRDGTLGAESGGSIVDDGVDVDVGVPGVRPAA